MSTLTDLVDPTIAQLLTIDAETDLLMAELALVDAECRWYAAPSPATAADLLEAFADVTDTYYLAGHKPVAA